MWPVDSVQLSARFAVSTSFPSLSHEEAATAHNTSVCPPVKSHSRPNEPAVAIIFQERHIWIVSELPIIQQHRGRDTRTGGHACCFVYWLTAKIIVLLGGVGPSSGKHCGIGTTIKGRLGMEYLAIRDLVPFSHQNRSFSRGFSL